MSEKKLFGINNSFTPTTNRLCVVPRLPVLGSFLKPHKNCRFLGPIPDLLNQSLGMGLAVLSLNKLSC